MADNPSSSLPQDAAMRLMELKKKILAGSSSKPKTPSPEESKAPATNTVPAEISSSTRKQPLTMKSLMSSRRSSRRGSEEGIQIAPSTTQPPVQSSPATQPSPTPFVSRLKEAPAHRTADAAASKPKVISLTKTWVTTTQEREARQAAADAAVSQDEKVIVKRPRIVKAIVKKEQPVLATTIPRDDVKSFLRKHHEWVKRMVQELGLDETWAQNFVPQDRSDLKAFINHHRQFIKSSI